MQDFARAEIQVSYLDNSDICKLVDKLPISDLIPNPFSVLRLVDN